MRWWTIAGLCAAMGCAELEQADVDSLRHALCTRTPLPSSTGQSWRWGGGHGYPDIVDPNTECTDFIIISSTDTVEYLETTVNGAQPGTVIYVSTSGVFDLTGRPPLQLGDDVWLASSRGEVNASGTANAGGLLTRSDVSPMIEVVGSGVRITGLRIWGPDPEICAPGCSVIARQCCDDTTGVCDYRCGTDVTAGIVVLGDDAEVDNCDIAAWTHAGVWILGAVSGHVHHNYIHHVQRGGLGYPVQVGSPSSDIAANVLVENNRFQDDRHAVASSGHRFHDYTARDNLVLANSTGRVFDVHNDPGTPDAGGITIVQDNKIMVPNFFSFDVRANPSIGAYFFGNCTMRTRADVEPTYCLGPPPAGEGYQDDNDGTVCQRGPSGLPLDSVYVDYDQLGVYRPNSYDRTPDQCASLRWCLSPVGERPYKYLNSSGIGMASLAFGDFDGDGRTDVFRTSGTTWYVSFAGVSSWNAVKTDSTPLAALRFGDFSGDGKTDVFRSQGGRWEYVAGEPESGGTWGGWTLLRNDTLTVTQLAVGYFDAADPGNVAGAKADIFRANGDTWEFRKNGTGTTWYSLNTGNPWSNEPVGELGFGDFNADGLTDVFSATGTATGSWRLHLSGQGSQTLSYPNDLVVAKLRFGDLDGDGKTDVFYGNGRRWRYKSAGAGSWIQLAIAAEQSSQVWVANFDSSSRADVFFPECQ